MTFPISSYSNRKRHTKPCLYFQSARCPFSADECDFLHILDTPLPPSPVDAAPPPSPSKAPHRTKPCRYYITGSCRQGMWCRFKHPVDFSTPAVDDQDTQAQPISEEHETDENASPDIRDVDPTLKWTGKHECHPKYRTRPCREFLMGTCSFGDTCAYVHSPSSPPLPLSAPPSPLGVPLPPSPTHIGSPTWPPSPMAYPCPPQAYYAPYHPDMLAAGSFDANGIFYPLYTEQPQPPQSPSTTAGSPSPELLSSILNSPPDEPYPYTPPPSAPVSYPAVHFLAPPQTSANEGYGASVPGSPPPFVVFGPPPGPLALAQFPFVPCPPHTVYPYPAVPELVSHRRTQSNPPISQQKSLYYKTKPCKYWNADGECPKGDKCTFIHDPNISSHLSCEDSESSQSASLPSSPHEGTMSMLDEEGTKKDIHPITWRVVGGGVMMGGSREVCQAFVDGSCLKGDDCPLAHPSAYDDDVFDVFPSSTYHFPPILVPLSFPALQARHTAAAHTEIIKSEAPRRPSLTSTSDDSESETLLDDTRSESGSASSTVEPESEPEPRKVKEQERPSKRLSKNLSISVPSPPRCLPVAVTGDNDQDEFDWTADEGDNDIVMKCGDKVIRLTKAKSSPSSPTSAHHNIPVNYFFSAESP